MGFGISLNTAIAVMEGIIGGKGGDFVRTPKFNLNDKNIEKAAFDGTYVQPISAVMCGEIGLGIYALLTIIILEPYTGWKIIPWMIVYSLGYFYIAGLNLIQHWQAQSHRSSLTVNQHA
jgi:hypothetical protein